MRKEPLLTAVPPAPVRSLSELYAIAFDLAQKAAQRYGALAGRIDEDLSPVRCVFEVLATRERDRADSLSAACLAACGKRPDASDLRWTPIDLVPAAEIADVGDSSLSTPYTAWALAARHRQRAFVFWTYVIALAEDPLGAADGGGAGARSAVRRQSVAPRASAGLARRAEDRRPRTPRLPMRNRRTCIGSAAGESSSQGHHRLVARIDPRAARLSPDHGSVPACRRIS